MNSRVGFLIFTGSAVILAACAPSSKPGTTGAAGQEPEYDIVTLLPKDAIPSIDRPRFYGVQEADAEYEPDEVVTDSRPRV
ncbi:MAG: hypothetical protein BMS9Abin28_0300 [Anaerolineae bacterium]|nr:MAG: hypothetical protein BMS9Abin28_0300 [Anaerolineae bacterium]